MDAGLLIARLILGLAISAHGAQKLFGWFGGYGLNGTGGFFESIGFRPGRLFALAAGLAEFGGGVLTALGFLGPAGPALIILVMMVALLTVHLPHGFFAQSKPGRTSRAVRLPSTPFATYSLWRGDPRQPTRGGGGEALCG